MARWAELLSPTDPVGILPAMKMTEAMGTLGALGTAQNRKVYARHGVRPGAFGVSYANLGKLVKTIGVDHDLALRLWASGNHDACILATMVAAPDAFRAAELRAWARELDSYVITRAFADLVARSAHAHSLTAKWIAARDEWSSACGWFVIARLAKRSAEVELERFGDLLNTLERTIHGAPNRTRYAMNDALIALGGLAQLRTQALATAKRIGIVTVDHGETGCRTPDAHASIEGLRTRSGQRRRKA